MNASPQLNDLPPTQNSETGAAREGQLLEKRRRHRRLDLASMHGVLRESARCYRDFIEGRTSAAITEIRSRTLRRHSEILAAVEQSTQLAELQRDIAAIAARPPQHLNFDAPAVDAVPDDVSAVESRCLTLALTHPSFGCCEPLRLSLK
jgi:hypothetical protein